MSLQEQSDLVLAFARMLHVNGESTDETITEQYHGENTKSLQDDKKISNQGNGNGRPPLMKK